MLHFILFPCITSFIFGPHSQLLDALSMLGLPRARNTPRDSGHDTETGKMERSERGYGCGAFTGTRMERDGCRCSYGAAAFTRVVPGLQQCQHLGRVRAGSWLFALGLVAHGTAWQGWSKGVAGPTGWKAPEGRQQVVEVRLPREGNRTEINN